MTSICVLTGAGISTASGIPDFRGPDGVWTRDPGLEEVLDYQRFVSDPAVRRRSWELHQQDPMWTADPNAAHRSLVDLERSGLLSLLVTQNIDRLHHFAGSTPDRVVELHGNVFDTVCIACGARGATGQALARFAESEEIPACLECGGILKTDVVMFGEELDAARTERAERAARAADLFVAIGTSLSVWPAAGLVEVAAGAGASVVIVNAQPTPADGLASRIERGPIEQVLPELVREWIAAG
ncbi:NAD-dependent deacetylase [Nakamurella silvestris]|nr:NAD-dependent deacetylase [Nakamurella silvestris]